MGPSIRVRLLALLEESNRVGQIPIRDDTSLIRSGLIDSLALFNLAAWVEREVDHPLDLTAVDLREEWDTIPRIIGFIERNRGGGSVTERSEGPS